MAQVDRYGPQIEKHLTRAAKNDRGISITEMVEKIGCTEGRIRQWLKRNAHRVRTVGVNEHKANLWVLDENAAPQTKATAVLPAIKVGEDMRVASIRESSGSRVVVEVVVGGKKVLATLEGLPTTGALVRGRCGKKVAA